MNLTKGKKVYVFFDPHIAASFVEYLTIQKQSEHLIFFEEKDPYYAVEYKEHLFYAYSYNVAGNVLIVEKQWHLPWAKLIERCRRLAYFFRKKPAAQPFNKVLKKDSLSIF